MIYLDASALVKLVVEEPESTALLAAIQELGPYLTSVVGEIELVRASHRANIPGEQTDEVRRGLVLVVLDADIRSLACVTRPPQLRTLDAIHLATALVLREDLEAFVTYDARLAEAVEAAGLPLLAPE